jgi:hypothetical protein
MAPATTMSSRAGTDFTASAPAPASPGAVIPATTTAGIYRNGNTYSDTQTPGSTPLVGYGATGGKGGTVNTVPAAAFTGGSPGDSAALQAARQAAADRGDFGAVRDSYQANGGTFLGKTAAQDAHTKALADAQRGIYTAKTIPQQKNAIDLYNHMVTAEATGVHNTAQITQAQAETARKGREDAMKGYTDLLKAQADGDEKAATAAVKKLQYGAAVSHLANGGTPAEAAHIAGGGALTADHYSVPITYMGGFGAKDQVPLVNQTKGTLKTVTPSAQVNEANITQHMKETGMSRAQSIAAHKARGFDTSALK